MIFDQTNQSIAQVKEKMFGLVGEKCVMMEIKVKHMVSIVCQKLAKVREVILLAEL